jgi:hypothetical protein
MPCDSNFTVIVPSPLYKVSSFEGAHGAGLEADVNFGNGFSSYVALQSRPAERQFGIVIMDVPRKERKKLQSGNSGGFTFMIGGDDAEPTSEKTIRSNNLVGKEYVFAKAIRPDRYTRGRIFYVGGRIYFVIILSRSAEDLASPDADRFLNSFALRKKKR